MEPVLSRKTITGLCAECSALWLDWPRPTDTCLISAADEVKARGPTSNTALETREEQRRTQAASESTEGEGGLLSFAPANHNRRTTRVVRLQR